MAKSRWQPSLLKMPFRARYERINSLTELARTKTAPIYVLPYSNTRRTYWVPNGDACRQDEIIWNLLAANRKQVQKGRKR